MAAGRNGAYRRQSLRPQYAPGRANEKHPGADELYCLFAVRRPQSEQKRTREAGQSKANRTVKQPDNRGHPQVCSQNKTKGVKLALETDARSAISAFEVSDRRFEKRREGHSPRLRHVRREDAACKGGAQPLHWRTDYDSLAECAQLQGGQKVQGCGKCRVATIA